MQSETPRSKVLVLDDSPLHAAHIKRFCEDNSLVPLKVRKGSALSVLRTNIDLGGILYSETYGGTPEQTARIAMDIHRARPELPIILRRESQATLTDVVPELQQTCCAAYVASDINSLRAVIDEYIFCMLYPNALLRGICEITTSILTSQLQTLTVTLDTPYIVHDRVIYGGLFSLIPLESAWCRGYMMLQVEERPLAEFLAGGELRSADAFREVSDLLGEITNLIWGSFKNRYVGEARSAVALQTQVPIIVNHERKYISFGTQNPQLCFRYTLTNAQTGHSTSLWERFIFNLQWSPDDFTEIPQDVAGLVDAGTLEFL
jgi:hypothetical protein